MNSGLLADLVTNMATKLLGQKELFSTEVAAIVILEIRDIKLQKGMISNVENKLKVKKEYLRIALIGMYGLQMLFQHQKIF